MLIYENTVEGLLDDIDADQLVEEIDAAFAEQEIGGVSPGERQAWRNSFQFIYRTLLRSDVPNDVGVAIEFKIPLTSNRVDLMLSGRDEEGNENVVVMELKQWDGETTQRVEGNDGIVETYLGGDIRKTTHPSYQAWSYANFLHDFNVEIQERPIDLHPVAYLHNYEPEYRDELENPIYAEYTEEAPVFLKGEVPELRAYLEDRLAHGDEGELLRTIAESELRPSKSLQDVILSMIEGNEEFTLLGSQKVVFEEAIELARQANENDEKHVLIVEGEPGTGKTVVAVNILVELLQHDLTAQYVSKNQAPREVYEQKLRQGDLLVKEINHLFTGAGSFVDAEPNEVNALIADEAHRLNEESNFFGRGENQIMEIINASQFSVFFIDESQRVHIKDIGSREEIHRHANDLGAEITEMTLDSQLRCTGSADYITWVDDLLEIEPAPSVRDGQIDYDIQLFDDPQTLHQAIERKNEQEGLSRVVAGYCWDWNTDHQDDPEYVDIEIGDYGRSWNLQVDDPWAIDEGSIDEVGCIHTCQGLEFEYVGVIIGPDLRMEDGELVTDFRERAGQDSSVHGMKKMSREQPEKAQELADELIKNTYRTLLTRGMQGCYIYCCDDDLQEYVRRRISRLHKQAKSRLQSQQ
ncbi:DUF2075 domain-containing protein [Salinarchaeum sp. IM2453]|uniref:DUF2075 domain-containing protein n=1 Tax=Salinarchaeum sp. IM2453 TaxID=2862870 RepID=UPI001C837EEB|nr:DUF2075 domain-containing protein [Salinarchaeum sp. IM2453]QZA89517.1 DUF2075 domain-containing protein [Salinarchaeum sp. IM2453]